MDHEARYLIGIDVGYVNYAVCVFDKMAGAFVIARVIDFLPLTLTAKQLAKRGAVQKSKRHKQKKTTQTQNTKTIVALPRRRKAAMKPKMDKLSTQLVIQLKHLVGEIHAIGMGGVHVVCETQIGTAKTNETLAFITKAFFETQDVLPLTRFEFLHSITKFKLPRCLRPTDKHSQQWWDNIAEQGYAVRKQAAVDITLHFLGLNSGDAAQKRVDDATERLFRVCHIVRNPNQCLRDIFASCNNQKLDDIGDSVTQVLFVLTDDLFVS